MKSKKYPVGTGGGRRPDRAERKRREALERNASWAALAPIAKERALNERLGLDSGAGRQRSRLARVLP